MHTLSRSESDASDTQSRHERNSGKASFTVASLFAGIGGFCQAFRNEGFRVVWANENDKFAAETYGHNFPGTKLYEKSIEHLSVIKDELMHVDVMTAGFPCQPFSVAGAKMGFRDSRGRLFFDIARLLHEYGADRPKILLLENVPHLLSHDGSKTFSRIVQEIQMAGYWFMPPRNHAVLNTRIHTNIPQNRERLYMVALSWDHFDENKFRFPVPTPETRDCREFLDLDQRAEDWYYFSPDSRWGRLFAESMESGDPESIYLLRRYYVRENRSKSAFTLTANMGEGGHNQPVIRDAWGIRKLTPKECLRLQGFVDGDGEFEFPASVSRTQQYRQVGNAVTVPLVRRLATECRRQLEERLGRNK